MLRSRHFCSVCSSKWHLVMLAFAVLVSCLIVTQVSAVSGVVEKTMDLPSFNRIVADVPANIALHQTGGSKVKLIGEPSVLEKLKVDVTDGVLNISSRGPFSTQKPLVINVELKKLEYLVIKSPSDVELESLVSERLSVSVLGTADVVLNGLKVNSLEIQLEGSATISANGNCGKQAVSLRGSGDWIADNLESRVARVKVEGSGSADLWVTQLLDVQVTGAGTVRYRGKPTLHQKVSDVGTVERL